MSAEQVYAHLYQALAEALAEPPEWLADSGDQWPLVADLVELMRVQPDPVLQHLIDRLAEIPAEVPDQRRARYDAMFGTARPNLLLYESLAREGRLAGSVTFAVWQIYGLAGLNVADSELPDHASVELAFLAYLASREAEAGAETSQWRKLRRLFLKHHAGAWLTALGKAMAQTNDAVYSPIGDALAYAMRQPIRSRRKQAAALRARPQLAEPEQCNLCSFCVQVCPTQALTIQETDDTTSLLLNSFRCISCERCVKTCPTAAMQLAPSLIDESFRVLRQSPRAHCPSCGQPTVSRAEIEAVSKLIGTPAWLEYCPNCRTRLVEKTHELPG